MRYLAVVNYITISMKNVTGESTNCLRAYKKGGTYKMEFVWIVYIYIVLEHLSLCFVYSQNLFNRVKSWTLFDYNFHSFRFAKKLEANGNWNFNNKLERDISLKTIWIQSIYSLLIWYYYEKEMLTWKWTDYCLWPTRKFPSFEHEIWYKIFENKCKSEKINGFTNIINRTK